MKLKKIALAALASSMAFAATAMAADFADIRGHWAEDVINGLADAGVVHGISNMQFNPDGAVTRAEFLKMAMGAAGIENVPYRNGECLDVAPLEWYGGCVQSALDKGLIPEAMIENYSADVREDSGSSKVLYSGSFKGGTPITREEMAYITESVYQYSLDKEDAGIVTELEDMYFSDVAMISTWAFDGVHHAYADGFIAGMDDDTFAPRATATRAQSAVIISRLLEKSE